MDTVGNVPVYFLDGGETSWNGEEVVVEERQISCQISFIFNLSLIVGMSSCRSSWSVN